MKPPHLTDQIIDRWRAHLVGTGPARSAVAPFTGEALPELATTTTEEVKGAAIRARRAQEAWAARPAKERASILLRLAGLVIRDKEQLLDIVQWETGKSRIHAGIEVLGLPTVARYYAANGPSQLAGHKVLSSLPGIIRARVEHRPKGLVGVIAPWNYPLFLAAGDAVPALVAGNAVLSKADSQAPLSLLAVRALAEEAGVPRDVWQVVAGPGSQIGPALLDEVDHLAFTGSTATGRELAAECGRRLIGASMELGGKNPMIVRADADLKAAATGAVQAAFSNSGQICIGIERIFVHESVFDDFVAALKDAVDHVTLGVDYDFTHEMGSLTNADQLAVTEEHVADALSQGATLVAGGKARPDLGPFFHEPTVLTGVTPQMKAYAQETFGPVVSVYPVIDDQDAVTRANDTEYGLSASIWSKDLSAARELAARVRAGGVNINDGYASAIGAVGAPMGGMKQSGTGRRHGPDGILRYTESQTVTTQRIPMPYPEKTQAYVNQGALALKAQIAAARVRLTVGRSK